MPQAEKIIIHTYLHSFIHWKLPLVRKIPTWTLVTSYCIPYQLLIPLRLSLLLLLLLATGDTQETRDITRLSRDLRPDDCHARSCPCSRMQQCLLRQPRRLSVKATRPSYRISPPSSPLLPLPSSTSTTLPHRAYPPPSSAPPSPPPRPPARASSMRMSTPSHVSRKGYSTTPC